MFVLSGFSPVYADPPTTRRPPTWEEKGKHECVKIFCNSTRFQWRSIDVAVDCDPDGFSARYATPKWICSCLSNTPLEAFDAITDVLGKKHPYIHECALPLPPFVICPDGLLWIHELGHGLVAFFVIFYLVSMSGLSVLSYRLLK